MHMLPYTWYGNRFAGKGAASRKVRLSRIFVRPNSSRLYTTLSVISSPLPTTDVCWLGSTYEIEDRKDSKEVSAIALHISILVHRKSKP